MATAQQTPQQSLNQQVNLQVKAEFVRLKQDLKAQAETKILELKAKLLDPEFLFEKLSSFLCDPKVQEKIHNTFNSILNFLEKNLLKPVGDVRDFIQKIMDKVIKIRDVILEKINTVMGKLQEAIDPLSIVLRIAPIALKAMSGPAANGGVIHDLSTAIRKATNFISDIFNMVSHYTALINKYVNKCFKFIGLIAQALNAVTQLYNQIDQLIQYAKFLLLAYEGFCIIEDTPGGNEETETDNDDDLVETLTAGDILNSIDSGTNVADRLTTAYQQLLQQYTEQGQSLKAERFFKLKDSFVPGPDNTFTSEDIDYMQHYRVKLITHYNQEASQTSI